ncbi:hypothetical protein D3C76_613550 [compost metagenome]
MIETRRGRQNRHAHVRQLEHVLQVNARVWRFTRHQNHLPALLERDIGGTFDQVVASARRDGGQGPGGARHHHHRRWCAGARGHRRHPVFLAVDPNLPGGSSGIFGEEGLHHLWLGRQRDVGFGGHHQLRRLGNQEVHFALFAHQAIEQAQAVLGTRSASHRQRDAVRAVTHLSASASLPCRPPKPPLLMITTWVPGWA